MPLFYPPGVGDYYSGTIRYSASEIREYSNTGVTDGNGRIVFNLTVDGTATGVALFSSILAMSAILQSNTGVMATSPYFIVESVSVNLKQVTLRGLAAQAGLVILGIGISQTAFIGSGLTGYLTVKGLP